MGRCFFIVPCGYIAYGADVEDSSLADDDPKFVCWLNEHKLAVGHYYLVVGRFVPENNYEKMIREFMKSRNGRVCYRAMQDCFRGVSVKPYAFHYSTNSDIL